MRKPVIFILAFAVWALAWAPAPAVENDLRADKTLSPYFYIENGDPSLDKFPLKETRVKADISGVVADVVVTQRYSNDGSRPLNARYIFPASTRAAVHGMTMTIGEKIIKAKIKERETAQRIYDQAKTEGKSASLLKQQRPNVFSMHVANVMPGDVIDIELHYSELLVPTEGIYEFVYPTVVGPRFSETPAGDAPDADRWVQNPYLKQGSRPKTGFDIQVNLATGLPIRDALCKTHDTRITYDNAALARIALADPAQFGGDRDFILKYRLSGDKIDSGLLLYEGEDENFFLLMVQPPERVRPEDIPGREYIFVIDVSGSMNGFPLNTAKRLLKDLIGNLRDTDLFNVILFAGVSHVMAPSSLPATSNNIQKAIAAIDRQQGGGGTRLYSALEKGLAMPKNEAMSRSVIIVTDGYISAEREVFELIRKNLNRTNVFSFGIGGSVNRYLIEGMARAGLGEPFVVTDPADTGETAERFRQYVQSPVLVDISVSYDGFETYDVEPESIPDMFADRPVIVFGKWRGLPEGAVTLSGTGGSGEYNQTFRLTETPPMEMNRALPYLWARARIARLSDYNEKQGNPENRMEITTLGLTYNLLTAYTSFVAVHDVVRNPDANAKDVTQPLPLPKGVSELAVGGTMHSTPEPDVWILIVVALLVIGAGRLFRNRFRRGLNND